MTGFDPRLTPARPDLAATHLRGTIEASRYADGRIMHVCVELADLRAKPALQSAIDTQVLYGEDVTLYDECEGWAWVQLASDHYVGYLPRVALAEGEAKATHRVGANRTFLYPAVNMKAPIIGGLPLGAKVRVVEDRGDFSELADREFVFSRHLRPLNEKSKDFVAIAESFVGAPYLWGGKSSLGVDCSGLVQIALAEAGVAAPRDTDLQERALGTALPISEDRPKLVRGDLVFWKGHVGIMRDASELLHANAHHMLVASEPLSVARDRIRGKGAGEITAIKRL